MRGAADNDAVLTAAGAPAAVVSASVTLLRAAEAGGLPVATAADVVMDATAVIVEMLDNPSGRAVLSCAGCRAVAGATTSHMVRIGGEDGPIFHPGCAVCGKCKKPLTATGGSDQWCLRDPVTRQPCPSACEEASFFSGERTHVAAIATGAPEGEKGQLCRLLETPATAEAVQALREVLVATWIACDSFVRECWEKLQRRATSVSLPSLRAALGEL
uniref:LIM zinc-binding domain-containing protein n=1 Tax=Neobodo designis TaxID=312471 RepID=A0A7S1KZU1_NEODS|mmetsp:Transcript_1084/g.3577  ORF Transcript_1084/g.3577 Transcript_1084/m.3577 type:complete len:216 (+) Transcript_1084:403-1050(+)